MKWVKTSERLPEANVNKFIKVNSIIMAVGFYNDRYSRETQFRQKGWHYTQREIIPNDYEIEWLDETEPNPPLFKRGNGQVFKQVKK